MNMYITFFKFFEIFVIFSRSSKSIIIYSKLDFVTSIETHLNISQTGADNMSELPLGVLPLVEKP